MPPVKANAITEENITIPRRERTRSAYFICQSL